MNYWLVMLSRAVIRVIKFWKLELSANLLRDLMVCLPAMAEILQTSDAGTLRDSITLPITHSVISDISMPRSCGNAQEGD